MHTQNSTSYGHDLEAKAKAAHRRGQGQGHKILSSRSRPVLEDPIPIPSTNMQIVGRVWLHAWYFSKIPCMLSYPADYLHVCDYTGVENNSLANWTDCTKCMTPTAEYEIWCVCVCLVCPFVVCVFVHSSKTVNLEEDVCIHKAIHSLIQFSSTDNRNIKKYRGAEARKFIMHYGVLYKVTNSNRVWIYLGQSVTRF